MRRYHKPCRFEDPEGNKCRGKAKAHDLCTGHATQQRRGQPLRPLGPWGRPPNEDGRWIDPKGFVFIKCPDPNHPNAKSRRGWIAEHVWVMTQMLGQAAASG